MQKVKTRPTAVLRERSTENEEEGVSGTSQFRRVYEGQSGVSPHSTADDSLQSVSHQLAINQSIPLMIFNHPGTGCPTVTSTSPFSPNQSDGRNSCRLNC